MPHTEDELDAFDGWERDAWEQRAAPYAASLGELTHGSIQALLDAAEVGAGSRVLDIGTGPGYVALAAQQRGAVVSAVDRAAAMVAIARAAGVDAQQASLDALPYGDGQFEAVVGGYVLNHLARPEAVVAELQRLLLPAGRLALTVWDEPAANPALGLFASVVDQLSARGAVPAGPDSTRFCAEEELRALLSGWQDVRIRRPRWTLRVAPGAWFDAVAAAAPRTGAVLAHASPPERAQARKRYVERATQRYGAGSGRVELPAGAVLVSARRPAVAPLAPCSTVELPGVTAEVRPDSEPSERQVLRGVVRLSNQGHDTLDFQTAQHAVGYLLDGAGAVVATWTGGLRASGHRVHLLPGSWQDVPFATRTAGRVGQHQLVVAVSVSPWGGGDGPSGHWVTPAVRVQLPAAPAGR